MPTPVLALPCGSKSMINTFLFTAANAVAKLTVVVVLPTPPFWLTTASMRGDFTVDFLALVLAVILSPYALFLRYVTSSMPP